MSERRLMEGNCFSTAQSKVNAVQLKYFKFHEIPWLLKKIIVAFDTGIINVPNWCCEKLRLQKLLHVRSKKALSTIHL